jgi:pimeloyl-ACP methyl ester carboxylesterase
MSRKTLVQVMLIATALAIAGCAKSRYAATSDFVVLGGDKLYFEVSGDGSPLVLVSGGSGMDLRQWQSIAPALSKKYRVISIDPRGIGRSENPSTKYSDNGDIVALLDHLELDRVALIGLSSSGGVVLEFASQHPKRVSGIVAAAPFIPGFDFSQAMLDRLDIFNKAAQAGKEPFLDAMFDDPHFIPAPLDGSVRAGARSNMADNYDKGVGFDPSPPIPIKPPLIERFPRVKSPVLLLAGELDHPEVIRRNTFLAEEISRAQQQVIVQAGHNTPLENPEEFLRATIPFLERLAR